MRLFIGGGSHEAKYGKLTGLTQFLKDLKEGTLHKKERATVTPIVRLSEDGLEDVPSGVFYQKGEWFKAALFNGKKIRRAFESGAPYLSYKGKAAERGAAEAAKGRGKGGVFVFPEGKNASLEEIGKALYRAGEGGALFSTGRFFYGAYKREGMSFNEGSSSLDLIGVTMAGLLRVAKMLAEDLGQYFLVFDGEKERWGWVEST